MRKKKDKALRTNGESAPNLVYYQTLIESLSDGYMLIDPDGFIKEVNSAYCRMLGYTKEELLQKTIFDIRPGMDPDLKDNIIPILAKDKTRYVKTIHRTKEGKDLELLATLVAIEKDDGTYMAKIVKNISERDKVVRKLEKLCIFNSKLLESTNDGYILANLKGSIEDVNPAYCNMVGYTREELLRMTIEDLEANFSKEEIYNVIELVVSKGNAKFETIHRHRSGKEVILESSLTLIDEVQGGPHIVGFVRDITLRKRALKEQIESEKRWQRLVKYNPQPVILSKKGKIVYINEAGVHFYGAKNKDELLNSSIYDLIHPEDASRIMKRIQRLEKGDDIESTEVRVVKKSGDISYLEVHSIPTVYQGEVAIQSVLNDVTNRILYQEKIEESLLQKETLLKEIHHRVKNNMAVVYGLMELQMMNAEDPKLIDQLRDSQQRIKTMADIHEKLYQNELLTSISCSDQVKDLVLSLLESYRADEVKVHYDLEPILLNVHQAIPCALIMNELISNCLKHAFSEYKNAQIWVRSRNEEGEVILEISDNGIGIPKGLDISSQDSLGMTIVHLLASQLKGEIKIYRQDKGAGTLCRLTFPVEN